ncbi:MAG TPA: hypothetical protein VKS03_07340, partial [Thermoanaerobaculia bacterium]|nr:hypothetical protein [Thermoanaerobaculia bacterium]
VPPDDVSALATAISELFSDRDAAFALGQRARARALQSYSTERVAETLQGVVANVTSRRMRRPEKREVWS